MAADRLQDIYSIVSKSKIDYKKYNSFYGEKLKNHDQSPKKAFGSPRKIPIQYYTVKVSTVDSVDFFCKKLNIAAQSPKMVSGESQVVPCRIYMLKLDI